MSSLQQRLNVRGDMVSHIQIKVAFLICSQVKMAQFHWFKSPGKTVAKIDRVLPIG